MSDKKIDGGYEGNVPDDFFIPASGIEETDRALFNLFNKTIPFQVKVDNKPKMVPVVFATGERFALTRRKSPIRDRNNALILPIISIRRTTLDHGPSQGGYKTAIAYRNQQSYVIRKRLDPRDRDYQKIINKLRLKNQSNVAARSHFDSNDISPGNIAKVGKIASRRNDNNLSFLDDPSGDLLKNKIGENIFEIITVPYPKFVAIDYEVVFWTQYMQHMNQMIEMLFSFFSGQGHDFLIESEDGYQYVAFLKPSLTSADNLTDFSSDERIVRYTFNMTVPTYILAQQHEGLPQPFRKFISAPQIEFGYHQVSTEVKTVNGSPDGDRDLNKFILNDVQNINVRGQTPTTRGQGSERLLDTIVDPFTGEKSKRWVKIKTRNQRSGETVASSRIVVDLETQFDTVLDEDN